MLVGLAVYLGVSTLVALLLFLYFMEGCNKKERLKTVAIVVVLWPFVFPIIVWEALNRRHERRLDPFRRK